MNREQQREPGEVMAPARNGTLVIRSTGWICLAAGLRLVAAAVLTVTAAAPGLGGGSAARVGLGLAAAALVVIAVRTFLEGVHVEANGVVVRNVFRSWRLSWDELEDVAPRRRNLVASLTLRSGKRIPVCGWGWISQERREQMASLLLDARPRHLGATR